ncbi:MAG: type II toxin-antitoxin system RelE/ParE family toxin [Deltaproteobacteria bacterium]|nr:type II toxin-antitoxin system RelE/ParE family toxin [Deltaproteobacteria bacterium]
MSDTRTKELVWIASSKKDLCGFPEEVRQAMGFALYQAQVGDKHVAAKPLKGFRGASVLEVVDDFDGDTYRTVYTVSLGDVVYVLHAFQKKSKRGATTPKPDIDLIKGRLDIAREQHAKRRSPRKGDKR